MWTGSNYDDADVAACTKYGEAQKKRIIEIDQELERQQQKDKEEIL